MAAFYPFRLDHCAASTLNLLANLNCGDEWLKGTSALMVIARRLDTPRYPFVPYQLSAIADCGFSIRHVVYWYGDRVAYALRAYQ